MLRAWPAGAATGCPLTSLPAVVTGAGERHREENRDQRCAGRGMTGGAGDPKQERESLGNLRSDSPRGAGASVTRSLGAVNLSNETLSPCSLVSRSPVPGPGGTLHSVDVPAWTPTVF